MDRRVEHALQAFRDAQEGEEKTDMLQALFKYFQESHYRVDKKRAAVEAREKFGRVGGFELLKPLLSPTSTAREHLCAAKTVAQASIGSAENKHRVREAGLFPLLGRYLTVSDVGGSLDDAAVFEDVSPTKLIAESISAMANAISRCDENKIEFHRLGYLTPILPLLFEPVPFVLRKVISLLTALVAVPMGDVAILETQAACDEIRQTPGAIDQIVVLSKGTSTNENEQKIADNALKMLKRLAAEGADRSSTMSDLMRHLAPHINPIFQEEFQDAVQELLQSCQTDVAAELTEYGASIAAAARQEADLREEIVDLHYRIDQMQREHVAQCGRATIAGLCQGLGYLTTRRLDLSADCFTNISHQDIIEMATRCPDLTAAFFAPGFLLPQEVISAIRNHCPDAHCLALGCEISEASYVSVRKQYERGDSELAELIPAIAEGVPPGLTLEPVDVESCVPFISLDLATSEFCRLTDEGLNELLQIFPKTNAVFLLKGTKVTQGGLRFIKQKCTNLRFAELGQQLTRPKMMELLQNCRQTGRLNLCDDAYADVDDNGLQEILSLCSGIKAAFTRRDSSISTSVLQRLASQSETIVHLSREVSESTFDQLQAQYASNRMLDLSGTECAYMTSASLPDMARLFPDVVAIFTGPSSPRSLRLDDVAALRPSSWANLKWLYLGQEISLPTFLELEQNLDSTRMLDLTSPKFNFLTDAGLMEMVDIPGLCTNLEAVFTMPGKVSCGALHSLKESCSWLQCAVLGQAISMETFVSMRQKFRENQVLDLSSPDFKAMPVDALAEIVNMFPNIHALGNAAKQLQSQPELNSFLIEQITRLAERPSTKTISAAPRLNLPLAEGATMSDQAASDSFQKAGALKACLDSKFPLRFNLLEIIGAGGSGLVVKARDKKLGRVAIKIVTPQVNGVEFTDKERHRVEREVATMMKSTHKNVCRIFESFFSDDGCMCVMILEYLNGQSLEDVVRSSESVCSEIDVLRASVACAEGLKAIHACGLVHRDIKADNIVRHVTEDGEMVYKIIDFGLAMASDEDEGATIATMMKTGAVHGVGTPHYMSPEQFGGDEIGPSSDIYSLGVTMFYMLTGKLPFANGEQKMAKIMSAVCSVAEAPDLRDFEDCGNGNIGDKVAEVVARAMRKDPAERFESAGDMLEAIVEAMCRRGYAHYDVMLSYRAVSEGPLAQLIFKRMSQERITLSNGTSRHIRVFLDKARLEDGERWDDGFVIDGIASSSVVIPIVSKEALDGFVKLAEQDAIDWLLLEWEVALHLEAANQIAKIYPVLLGRQNADGSRDDFFNGGAMDDDESLNFVSTMTQQQSNSFLERIDASIAPANRLVRETLSTILRFQAFNLVTMSGVHGSATDGVVAPSDVAAVETMVQKLVPMISSALESQIKLDKLDIGAGTPPTIGSPVQVAADADWNAVREFLQRHKLQAFEKALRDAGAASLADLRDLEDADVQDMGMKPLERKRFLREVQAALTS